MLRYSGLQRALQVPLLVRMPFDQALQFFHAVTKVMARPQRLQREDQTLSIQVAGVIRSSRLVPRYSHPEIFGRLDVAGYGLQEARHRTFDDLLRHQALKPLRPYPRPPL